jgi:hypothetical protein
VITRLVSWHAWLDTASPEHTYWLAKHTLGWDEAALRHPGQVARWTWLIIAALTQLRLARPIAADHRQRRWRWPGSAWTPSSRSARPPW